MKLKILVTAGDGIGPEVTNEAVAVLREVAELGGHTLELDAKRIGGVAIVQDGTPSSGRHSCSSLDSDAVLLGAVGGNEFNSLAPDKRPEAPVSCRFGLPSAASPICAPRLRSKNSPSTARSALKLSRAPTSFSFARIAWRPLLRPAPRDRTDRASRRSLEHHALYKERSCAGSSYRIPACHRSAAKN